MPASFPSDANSLTLHSPFLYMKRLYRSGTERMLGGVCGGLGEHLDVDPSIIRLIWVVVTAFSLGIGLIVYIAAWIIIPEEPKRPAAQVTAPDA